VKKEVNNQIFTAFSATEKRIHCKERGEKMLGLFGQGWTSSEGSQEETRPSTGDDEFCGWKTDKDCGGTGQSSTSPHCSGN